MGIKIVMPPEEIDRVANALVAKAVLREMVRRLVSTPQDAHYFAVVLHRGLSDELRSLGYPDIAHLLACPTSDVQRFASEHARSERAKGRCAVCAKASRQLKNLMAEERKRRSGDEPFSTFASMAAPPPALG